MSTSLRRKRCPHAPFTNRAAKAWVRLFTKTSAPPAFESVVIGGPDSRAQVVEGKVAETPFDISLYGLLLASFPLQEGLTARFPVLGQSSASLLALLFETATIGPPERLTVGSRSVQAWPVATTLRPWTAWVAKEPPYVLRIEQRLPDGSRQLSEPIP